MLRNAIQVVVVLSVIVTRVFSQSDSPAIPVLTVCESLTDPQRYHGKNVIVVGRFVATEEGTWLTENCGLRIKNGVTDFAPSISTSYVPAREAPPPEIPPGFKWDESVLRPKLQQVMRTTKLEVLPQYNYSDRWVAMFGRLETDLPRKVTLGDRTGFVTGFGHLNGSPGQLIGPKGGFFELK